MPNVTVTSAANFIPEIWANRALEILRANIVMYVDKRSIVYERNDN